MADQPADSSAESRPATEGPTRDDTKSRRMIDVQGMIKQASTRVSVNQLVQQGKKYISLLSKERIEELINQSVKTIVDKYRGIAAGVSNVSVGQIEAEAKGEFNELLQEYQQSQKAKAELQNTRDLLDVEIEDLRKELQTQKALADGTLNEEVEKALVLGFKEFERELDKVVVKVFQKRKLILQESESPEAVAELKGVESTLRPIIARLVATERQRFAAVGESKMVAMLEKRIEKLYAQMAAMENALKTISNSKLYSNQQIQNLLRQLGLANEDKYFEKKREMLKIVLDANKDIRQKAKEFQEKGIDLTNPKEAMSVSVSTEVAPAKPAPAPPAP